MTLDERIEAAAAAMGGGWFRKDYEDPRTGEVGTSNYTGQTASMREHYRERARLAILAAFPELFTDPPTGWIAPWTMPAEIVIDGDEWVQMRDEYLHHYPTKPTEATKEE